MKTYYLYLVLFIFIPISYAQWQPDFRLTTDPGSSFLSYSNAHSLAVEGMNLNVVWWDGRDLDAEIYFNRSINNGLNWQTDTRLTNSAGRSEYPSIAVSGSNVHIVWMDDRDGGYEIYYKHSSDAGVNWSTDEKLTSNPSDPGIPSLAVSGSDVHIVWHDIRDGNWEIYYKRSTDNGLTWQPDVRLTNSSAVSERTSISVSGQSPNEEVFVVWQDERDNDKEIYFKNSTDGGVSWSGDIRLTNNVGESEAPTLAVEESNINVVWSDSRNGVGNGEIYYKKSTDGGLIWSEDIRITNTPFASGRPSIAISSNFVHISWNEVWEIYYIRSTDYGNTWENSAQITYNPSWDSENSCLALSGSIVHLIWQDEMSGNEDIYYKQNPTGNIITGTDDISMDTPKEFQLEQNYPNPFNPSTKISWQSPVSGWQTIKIYDVLGKEIETIFDEYKSAGMYNVQCTMNNLSSGIYFYRLQVGDFVQSKKMILIK